METPNERLLTDVTEFRIPAGKLCFSPMIDCIDGLVVSWTIGTRPDSELVNTMWHAAIEAVADFENWSVIYSDGSTHN